MEYIYQFLALLDPYIKYMFLTSACISILLLIVVIILRKQLETANLMITSLQVDCAKHEAKCSDLENHVKVVHELEDKIKDVQGIIENNRESSSHFS